ncbi:hypothetical protein CHU92_02890 [Flavobacterium cyanobacteriorum]|uniref:Uncharacterized protein n=1 Tax=Flavobacterium cyanobacteriorum TaxID=2022802 RepID=A0A255ZSV8_9FLAO|nr:hypothetical protein [Flavobacterium cyanobacteriorum]OYQ43810.1 hypothetical protein CHU92_02890 [Flavobacterium cyanobacteriorum]
MAEYKAIGGKISIAAIRSYLFDKKIDKGDTLVLNLMDYEHILDEIRYSGDKVDIPVNVLGVLLTKSNDVPAGKIQIVKNEKTIE